MYDIGEFLRSLDVLEALEGTAFVPSHAPAVSDIRPLVQISRAACEQVAANIWRYAAPHTGDEVLKALFDGYGLVLDMHQYAICGATVRSYFAYLEEGPSCARGVRKQAYVAHRMAFLPRPRPVRALR